MAQPRNQNTKSRAAMRARARKPWTHQTTEMVAWHIPSFRRIVKQEFLALAQRHGMTCSGLLEDVLVDYLTSQGRHIGDKETIQPPAPPAFTAKEARA